MGPQENESNSQKVWVWSLLRKITEIQNTRSSAGKPLQIMQPEAKLCILPVMTFNVVRLQRIQYI